MLTCRIVAVIPSSGMEAVYAHIDKSQEAYFAQLKEAVAIQSVSADPAKR
jgi:hypothetical protein